MGEVPRFDVLLEKHIGVGLRWQRHGCFSVEISLSVFFVTIIIGLGERL